MKLKTPTIKNTVKKKTIEEIPSSVEGRRRYLERFLRKFEGKDFPCPALGVKVKITRRSVDEVAGNAACSLDSTIAVLNFRQILMKSVFVKGDIPRSNTQKQKFHFVFTYILEAELEGIGITKNIVGVRINPEIGFAEYSLTVMQNGKTLSL